MSKDTPQYNIKIEIGNNIYNLRKAAGYNQDQLSSAVGLTRASIVNIEAGRQGLTVETLLKICAVLKCQPANILPKVPSVSMTKKENAVKIVTVVKKQIKSKFKW